MTDAITLSGRGRPHRRAAWAQGALWAVALGAMLAGCGSGGEAPAAGTAAKSAGAELAALSAAWTTTGVDASGLGGTGAGAAGGPGAALGSTSAPVAKTVPGAPPTFSVVQPLARSNGVIRERVWYWSDGLHVSGQVCRPDSDHDTYPILMYQHAGFGGLRADWDGLGFCRYMADRGYAVFMSSYRGEDGSEGTVEYCKGEVDDSIRLLEIARAQPYVQPGRVGLLGISHGGCISLEMIARGVDAQVVVDVVGPTDWAHLFLIAAARVQRGDASADEAEFVAAAVAAVGTPYANPLAYRVRSPLAAVDVLRWYPGAMLVLHGAEDTVVPAFMSCELVYAMGGFTNSHLDWRYIPRWSESTSTRHPAECGDPVMEWAGGAHPGKNNWQGQRHFVFYDRMGHGTGYQMAWALDDMENFIRTKFPGH
jgi:alpha/beta superfamily hydrolase